MDEAAKELDRLRVVDEDEVDSLDSDEEDRLIAQLGAQAQDTPPRRSSPMGDDYLDSQEFDF